MDNTPGAECLLADLHTADEHELNAVIKRRTPQPVIGSADVDRTKGKVVPGQEIPGEGHREGEDDDSGAKTPRPTDAAWPWYG